MLRRDVLALALGLAAVPLAARAAELPRPSGKVILTVTGKIKVFNAENAAVFDLDMLSNLPGRKSVVNTPWYTGPVAFEGPLGSALLGMLGVTQGKLRITALNDYAAEIPVEDFYKWPVILATKADGKALSVREKGPIFVVYPFDADPNLFNELYFNRSVWQVKSIEVL